MALNLEMDLSKAFALSMWQQVTQQPPWLYLFPSVLFWAPSHTVARMLWHFPVPEESKASQLFSSPESKLWIPHKFLASYFLSNVFLGVFLIFYRYISSMVSFFIGICDWWCVIPLFCIFSLSLLPMKVTISLYFYIVFLRDTSLCS